MQPNVPLLVPDINPTHLSLLNDQPTARKIITNPNCSSVEATLTSILMFGGVKHVSVVTLQSISGAGYPGVPSIDILGNSIPHIDGEADKITEETKRIFGTYQDPASFSITTNVHRVPLIYGHTIALHITFKNNVKID